MAGKLSRRRLAGWTAAGLGLGAALAAEAQEQEEKRDPAKPAEIWQASLARVAGTYRYTSVASPGGLWETYQTGENRFEKRQVGFHSLPDSVRTMLTGAEVVISDLKLPTRATAEQRRSPSGRGMLRYFEETCIGRLRMKGIPGVGGDQDDRGVYDGWAEFHLTHQSHSNPSPSGVFILRQQQEPTWGFAVLDYADLQALPATEAGQLIVPERRPQDRQDPEPIPVMMNARVVRSATEIFTFFQTSVKESGRTREFVGAIRLLRSEFWTRPGEGPETPRPSRT